MGGQTIFGIASSDSAAGRRFFFRPTTAGIKNFSNGSSDAYYGTGWHHLAWVARGDGVLSLYVDGQYLESISHPTSITLDSFGTGYPIAQYQFVGSLDDLRVYNKALEAPEIDAIYRTQY